MKHLHRMSLRILDALCVVYASSRTVRVQGWPSLRRKTIGLLLEQSAVRSSPCDPGAGTQDSFRVHLVPSSFTVFEVKTRGSTVKVPSAWEPAQKARTSTLSALRF